MKYFISAFFVITLIFLVCYDGVSQSTGPWEVSNINWVSDGNGFVQFSTNDYKRFGSSSIGFADNINVINTWEMECIKTSGAGNLGYGMIFNASERRNDFFYVILITIEGYYCIMKSVGSISTTIKNWSRSERLNIGYNVINTLKAVRNKKTITIFINGSQVFQFKETGGKLDGNRIGYFVGIGDESKESFPNVPVNVRFRQK